MCGNEEMWMSVGKVLIGLVKSNGEYYIGAPISHDNRRICDGRKIVRDGFLFPTNIGEAQIVAEKLFN